MLPRLKPRRFYDLVIEVAIVRPGPIQGDMVHPYLRRREGKEPVEYPSEALRAVLEKTCGVPLFQEQAMQIAIVAAGFSPGEADRLRRAMATFRHVGTIHTFREKFIAGMVANGYQREFAERCFSQIEGFGEYGFPESHAASFALLVYVSAWIKRHYPEAFCAALLNSQPMGFYAPAQLVRDARDHGVEVLHPDVNHSEWDCTLEAGESPSPRLRGEGRGEGQQRAETSQGQDRDGGHVLRAEPLAAPHPNSPFALGTLVERSALWMARGQAGRGDPVGASRTAAPSVSACGSSTVSPRGPPGKSSPRAVPAMPASARLAQKRRVCRRAGASRRCGCLPLHRPRPACRAMGRERPRRRRPPRRA